jgi:hypothetical protein
MKKLVQFLSNGISLEYVLEKLLQRGSNMKITTITSTSIFSLLFLIAVPKKAQAEGPTCAALLSSNYLSSNYKQVLDFAQVTAGDPAEFNANILSLFKQGDGSPGFKVTQIPDGMSTSQVIRAVGLLRETDGQESRRGPFQPAGLARNIAAKEILQALLNKWSELNPDELSLLQGQLLPPWTSEIMAQLLVPYKNEFELMP